MSLFVSGRRDDAVSVAEKADAFIGEVKAQNDAVLVTAENKYHSELKSELTQLKSFFDKHLAQVQAPKNQHNIQSKPKGACYWAGRTIVDADHDYLNNLQAFDFYSDDERQVEDLDQLVEHGTNSKKTCNFLSSSARYLAGPDDMLVLNIAFMVYLKFEEYPLALQIALYLDNREYMTQVFTSCEDLLCRKQFCYTIARHVSNFELSDEMVAEDEEREALQEIINNTKLSEGYLTPPSQDIEVMEAKTPEDIYKGPILLGDVPGLDQTDKYFHSNGNHVNDVIAGALFGVGIVNRSVKNDCDPALALLIKYIDKEDPSIRIGAIMGLGIAYAGAENEQICSRLIPILNDAKAPLDVITFAAISLGLMYVGSCNEEVAQAIISVLTDRSEAELGEPLARLIPLSLGLLYLGKQESVEATAEVSKKFNEKIRKHCDMTLLSCAYAGTGNVLKVENLLGHCSQHLEKGETHQGPALLGIAMVLMAEESGLEKAFHSLKHLLQYGERNIRRALPFALGLLFISNPKVKITVLETLSKLSHDSDSEVAVAAVVSLGVIGAGTTNARSATMLLNLSSYYYKDASQVICTRIIQGLDHLGKGLSTLKPYHSDRFLSSHAALGGIITMLHACLDMKAIILGKYHYVLYFLILAMQPRMLLTVDENLKPLSVPVWLGQVVDTVGETGCPKTITTRQTHLTPVLLAAGERAEMATEKYTPLSPILEGLVILKENPEYNEDPTDIR